MTKKPENLIDVLAEHAVAGILARLQWMTFHPKVIQMFGLKSDELIAQFRQIYPQAEFHGEQPDLIIANLFLPWQNDMINTIQAWSQQLQPQGLLIFTSLGPDTLKEWPDQNSCLINRIDMHDVGDAMVEAGLADPVMEVENYTFAYTDHVKMLQELVSSQLILDGTVHAQSHITCELVYGHAWKVSEAMRPDADGVTRISLNSLRAQLRRS